MASILYDLFSNEDIDYIHQLPQVLEAKAQLDTKPVVYFKIPLTDSIRNTLTNRFEIDLSTIHEIPMRWLKGDVSPHIDSGASKFENTYLAYLNSSEGEFVLENASYPITENTAFVFNEGLSHYTRNTGTVPRLLLGPMNEFAEPVGATITYYNNYDDAYNDAFNGTGNQIAAQAISWILNDPQYISGNIGNYTAWRVAYVYGGNIPTGVYNNGFDLSTLGVGSYQFYVYPEIPCFLEGTTVLCQIDGVDTYVPIENITEGTLVKTNRDGYKRVEVVGKGDIVNPGHKDRIENRLYKCSTTRYPELTRDLFITGCHSILVDNITDIEKDKLIKQLGKIFVTSKKYRLTAFVDERAEPWDSQGKYNIWHIALENPDVKMNYGIYVNGGLLVETCSINFLKNRSNMHIR
jgi:hypothetical protein